MSRSAARQPHCIQCHALATGGRKACGAHPAQAVVGGGHELRPLLLIQQLCSILLLLRSRHSRVQQGQQQLAGCGRSSCWWAQLKQPGWLLKAILAAVVWFKTTGSPLWADILPAGCSSPRDPAA